MGLFLALVTWLSFLLVAIPLNEVNNIELVILLTIGAFSSVLTKSAFFNDLRGVSLSSWQVTTQGRRGLLLFVGAACGLSNYASLLIVAKFLDELQGHWLFLGYGLLVILPSALCGYYFERVFVWGKNIFNK
uniref:hypothetical protein n=1 Tax=Thaumasiovibrio occultus TaxID=1891184 RepID=UPI00131EC60E|nr:hypothetical protein [Thaumasiovibrio occultus]